MRFKENNDSYAIVYNRLKLNPNGIIIKENIRSEGVSWAIRLQVSDNEVADDSAAKKKKKPINVDFIFNGTRSAEICGKIQNII